MQSPSAEEVRLLPLIYRRLFLNPEVQQAGAGRAPRATDARLRRAWAESRAARIDALRQLQEVLAALTPEMPVAPLWVGPALDAWYGGAGRPIGDLDLLVPRSDRWALPCAGSKSWDTVQSTRSTRTRHVQSTRVRWPARDAWRSTSIGYSGRAARRRLRQGDRDGAVVAPRRARRMGGPYPATTAR